MIHGMKVSYQPLAFITGDGDGGRGRGQEEDAVAEGLSDTTANPGHNLLFRHKEHEAVIHQEEHSRWSTTPAISSSTYAVCPSMEPTHHSHSLFFSL